MSNLPPPSIGPPAGPAGSGRGDDSRLPPPATGTPELPWNAIRPGTPGGPGIQPQPYIPPTQTSGGRTRVLIAVAAIVAFIAIGGAVTYVLTNDDGDGETVVSTNAPTTVPVDSTDPDPTMTTTDATAAATSVVESLAPTSTEATTSTVAPETTVAATTTTAVVIPAGAIDLGRGVYVPVPAGWSQTNAADSVVTLSDGTLSVAVQALARPPGEDPTVLVQEYVNTFDVDFETVSYGPTANIRRLDGEPAVDVYTTFYLTYDTATDSSLAGAVNVYIRGDGLALIYDVYGPASATGAFPAEAADAMRLSLQRAPLINTPVSLTPVGPFRVASAHPFVQVDGLVGFTASPGFRVITSGGNRGFVTNDVVDFQVDKVGQQPDTNAVTAAAQAVIAANYTGVAYTELTLDDPDPYGVVHGTFGWTGTFTQGNPSAGTVDFYYDPATQNAYIAFRTWFTSADNTEPFAAYTQIMLRSLFNSFTTIP